jgi:hypothetical protein
VPKDADIRIDGNPGKLAAIPPGAFVGLGLTVDRQSALTLHAQGPGLGGCGGSMVKSVSLGTRTITFDDKGCADVAGKTFTIAKDADITIDGGPGKLADIPPGAFANLTLTVDRQTARQVHVQGPRREGVLNAVDAAKGTLTVGDRTYVVCKDCWFAIGDKKGTLADLPIGAKVNLNLCVDDKTVRGVHVSKP